jgi:hypothetical protein
LRHTAISTALHSTLVMSEDGMNLHTLASYAGHDVQTMRYYSHVIARYRSRKPIDHEAECKGRAPAGRQQAVQATRETGRPAARGVATQARTSARRCRAVVTSHLRLGSAGRS